MLRQGSRRRPILLTAAALLLVVDTVWAFRAISRREQILIVAEPGISSMQGPDEPAFKDVYVQRVPAQLPKSGPGWIVDGKSIASLRHHLTAMESRSSSGAGLIENTRISLGEDPSFGRAIIALERLAEDRICLGGIDDSSVTRTEIPDLERHSLFLMFRIKWFRNRHGNLQKCADAA